MAPKKTYQELVVEAIKAMGQRGGSSIQMIKKYMSENHNMDFKAGADRAHLMKALRNGTEKGIFVKNKFSYRVAKAPKKQGGKGGGLQAPKTLSDDLAAVVGAKSLSRPQVVKKLWEYVKGNDLQNEENRRFIDCDAALKKVFGKKKVNMFEMQKLLSQHLS